MTSKPVDLPADLAGAYLALLSEREMLQAERDVVVAERDTVVAERDMAVAQAANAQAMLSHSEALVASMELAIEKLKRELRGRRSELCSPASPIFPSPACTNCCLGNGRHTKGRLLRRRVNSSRNNASERSKPSSVRINDFALLTGSPIKPFL